MKPLRIAWLTTGRGPGSFGALEYTLQAIEKGLPVRLEAVFVNRERGEAEPTDRLITFAEGHGIPVETLSSVRFRRERGGRIGRPGEPLQPWRFEYDAEVADLLARHEFDLGVMFGYMLIATEPLHGRFRFINDHPALPDGPIGTYSEVIAGLIRAGARESGCMMNVVTADVDRGATVSYCRYTIRDDQNEALWKGTLSEPIEESALFLDIRRRGVERERPFLAETLRAIAEGTLAVPPDTPLDLTAEVERAMATDSAGG